MKTIIFYFFALFFFSWSTFAAPIIPENYDLVKREHSHIQKHDQHHAVLDSHHPTPQCGNEHAHRITSKHSSEHAAIEAFDDSVYEPL
ncbi:hypothetical protein PIIN_04206 [Serendipita indica DSM 11827]|uniref:Uncharacterized protein n=1 Tax=Serendipita indica (strain DSM 11827) TaxID=1109443 RepID=G4TG36_SERID|nr:hypothetical protein PIIN_04206 [Serendipita indica DSM 11827]